MLLHGELEPHFPFVRVRLGHHELENLARDDDVAAARHHGQPVLLQHVAEILSAELGDAARRGDRARRLVLLVLAELRLVLPGVDEGVDLDLHVHEAGKVHDARALLVGRLPDQRDALEGLLGDRGTRDAHHDQRRHQCCATPCHPAPHALFLPWVPR